MKRWIKWTSGAIAVLGLAAMGAAIVGQQMAERKRMRQVSVPVTAVAYASGAQALARGRYLFESRGCTECHGADGAGRSFVNDGKGTHIAGPNITPAGVVANYQPVDWVRTIRHGVKPDGRPAMVMPSEDYNRFTDADLAALVAYARSLAPVKGGGKAVVELPLPAWVMYGFDVIPDAAQRINHGLPPAQAVATGVTVAHGAYVANMCIGCHGDHLSGGKIPGGPPDWPAAANLTPGAGSAMVRYKDEAQFVAMMRSGRRPDGTVIQVMPFESIGKMDDVDLPALYAYLKTIAPYPAGSH
jgi:mono/diheme cytochrome c family protein